MRRDPVELQVSLADRAPTRWADPCALNRASGGAWAEPQAPASSFPVPVLGLPPPRVVTQETSAHETCKPTAMTTGEPAVSKGSANDISNSVQPKANSGMATQAPSKSYRKDVPVIKVKSKGSAATAKSVAADPDKLATARDVLEGDLFARSTLLAKIAKKCLAEELAIFARHTNIYPLDEDTVLDVAASLKAG